MIISGDVKKITYNHPLLGSFTFFGKSGEDANHMKGGLKANDDDGNIGSNLERIHQLNAYPWSFETTILAKPGAFDYLQSATQSTEEGTLTVEYMDATVRTGTGNPVGDIQENKQAGTIAIKFVGSGTFEQI